MREKSECPGFWVGRICGEVDEPIVHKSTCSLINPYFYQTSSNSHMLELSGIRSSIHSSGSQESCVGWALVSTQAALEGHENQRKQPRTVCEPRG